MSQPALSTPDCADCGDVQAGTRRLDDKPLCEACLGEATRPAAWAELMQLVEGLFNEVPGDAPQLDAERLLGSDGGFTLKVWREAVVKDIRRLCERSDLLDEVLVELEVEKPTDVRPRVDELVEALPPRLLAIDSIDAALIRDAVDPAHALDLYLARVVRK